MSLRHERDVVLCRNHAREIAAGFHFASHEQTYIATAISEIARNAFSYGTEGTAEFLLEASVALEKSGVTQTFVCVVRDQGPGIAHLDDVLSGIYHSETGMGMGIIGARRLMDRVDFDSTPQGTTVRLLRHLPKGVHVPVERVQNLMDSLRSKVPINPLDELTVQNQELLRTLDEIAQQREEVAKINEELSETNRGVVALYDELDTIYRVGRVVATKLDLDSLMQAITDATTDLSGAEFGAFYHLAKTGEEGLVRRSTAGPLAAMLESATVLSLNDLLGANLPSGEVLRIDNLQGEDGMTNPLGEAVPIRSYLAVPVCDMKEQVAGCLVFGHRTQGMFTERSERILSSVAMQASIGLENARLYHSVRSASAAKDQFLAVLSHELRTPLNPVFAVLASLEQNAEFSDDVRADLLVMRRNLQLEARLIDDLLDLTRIVKGKVPLQLEVVDVHSIIQLAYETCMAAVTERAVNVEMQLNAPRHYAKADAARLQQVFWNLLSNAVKFTPATGKVTVRTSTDDDGRICVLFSDTGRGIEMGALQKIFQPFEQGDAVIPVQFGGLGLGLAISKSILDAHGGDIHAESGGLGRGATFIVTLPTVEAPLPSRSSAKPARARPAEAGLRILLVDDHADTRHSLQRLLSRRGYLVILAANCQEALMQAGKQDFDLVISDLGLPDGSGHDLMRTLVATHPRLTGIALSGYGMEADVQRSHAAGFAAHLTKPLDFAALEATIDRALEHV